MPLETSGALYYARNRLEKRVKDIKGTIDTHLSLLMNQVAGKGSSSKENPLMYDNFDFGTLSYSAKVALLVSNETLLYEKKKKDRKPILRMKGITQSYYMYDSLPYKNSKQALDEMMNLQIHSQV